MLRRERTQGFASVTLRFEIFQLQCNHVRIAIRCRPNLAITLYRHPHFCKRI